MRAITQVVLAGVGVAAGLASACGGPCQQVEAARLQLTQRPAVAAVEPHARVRVPFQVANRAIAEALAEPPEVPVSLRRLGPLRRLVGELHAVPRSVTLSPAGPGKLRVAFTVELRDQRGELVTFDGHAEVEPVLQHTDTDAVLSIGIDPRRVDGVELELGPRASARLRDGLLRRMPGALRGRVPGGAVETVASAVVEEVGEETWKVLRRTLLPRIDALTRVRVRLPDVPVERVALTSIELSPVSGGGAPVPVLDLAIATSLPVRAGLDDPGGGDALVTTIDPDGVDVRLAGGTVAELANWAIATGRAPRRYTRKLSPDRDGDYQPLLDWREGHPRPLVVSVFQLDRGCSCFSAGVRPRLEVKGDRVIGTLEERRMELALGPPHIEALAWLKDVVDRAIERSRAAAAHTELTVGERTIRARLVDASVDRAQLYVAVRLSVGST